VRRASLVTDSVHLSVFVVE